MRLDREAAARAIDEHVAQAARALASRRRPPAIYDIVNVTMATGVREVSVRRGLDPRDFPLVVAGGAGPVHAAAIAAELEIPLLVVPRESSIFCAAGMLMSDFKHDFVRAYKAPLAGADGRACRRCSPRWRREGRAVLAREGVGPVRRDIRNALDLRYVGQWHELTVPIVEHGRRRRSQAAFHAQHDRLFGYSSPGVPIELLAVRTTALGSTGEAADRRLEGEGTTDAEGGARRERPVWDPHARALRETPVYDGLALGAGARARRPGDRRAREHDDRRARRASSSPSTPTARSSSPPARRASALAAGIAEALRA